MLHPSSPYTVYMLKSVLASGQHRHNKTQLPKVPEGAMSGDFGCHVTLGSGPFCLGNLQGQTVITYADQP